MGTCIKKDLFKYKQHPYFEKPNKKERTSISRAFRHLAKIQINKGDSVCTIIR